MPRETITTCPANAEMVDGYMDGRDPSNPEPSDNRSRSYRHGFRSGRADLGFPREETFEQTRAAADKAMEADDNA
jgi:hypothetical protein